VDIGERRQDAHHGKLIEGHGPVSQGQPIESNSLSSREEPPYLGENALAVIGAELLCGKLLRM
jgi:hypothetical protein